MRHRWPERPTLPAARAALLAGLAPLMLVAPPNAAAQDSLTSALIRGDGFVAAYDAHLACLVASADGATPAAPCARHRRAMERYLIAGGVAPAAARDFVARLGAGLETALGAGRAAAEGTTSDPSTGLRAEPEPAAPM